LWFARDPEGMRPIYVYRERYATGLRDEEQAESIVDASGDERIVASVLDPSMFNARTEQNRPSIARVYAEACIPNIIAGHNNRRTGWSVVRRAMAVGPPAGSVADGQAPQELAPDGPTASARLRIFRYACPNLIRTLRRWSTTRSILRTSPTSSTASRPKTTRLTRSGMDCRSRPGQKPTSISEVTWG
jgi:hypothetical protein